VNEYLGHLHREGLIAFQRNGGVWTWDMRAIQERGVSDSLVELVRSKILKTPPATREALQIGASLGSRVRPGYAVGGDGPAALGADPGAAAGAARRHRQPGGAAYQLMETGDQEDGSAAAPVSFPLCHDRVRQGPTRWWRRPSDAGCTSASPACCWQRTSATASH
jgi:hypothetical protein